MIPTKHWTRTALCVFLLAEFSSATDTGNRWKIANAHIEARTGTVRRLSVSVTDSRHLTTFTLSADVVLSNVREHIVYRDKLALLGDAGSTRAVVVFDLMRREQIDWFYCDASKQVLPGKLVSATWAPNHAGGLLFDTVLVLYDLAKAPSENRLKRSPNLHFPWPAEAEDREPVINVGVPIYPQANADEASYFATPREPGEPTLGVDVRTMVALSRQKLVFVASKGVTGQDAIDWLEVLDLPRGATKAKSRRIPIPIEQLHPGSHWVNLHQPFNPKWVPINQIDVISSTHVRLYLSPEEYDIDSFDVHIPSF